MPEKHESPPALPRLPGLMRQPVLFLASGFGSGLAPRAPGTAGTAVAVPVYLLAAQWGLLHYAIFIALTAALGVWICGEASRRMGAHDHPGIVWDEFVGYWITMWALPVTWEWVLAGFLVFRLYDIVKPWPVGLLDRKVEGGLGIMLDDVLAGAMACVTLHIVLAFGTGATGGVL